MNNYQCTMSQLRPSNELMEKLMNNQMKNTRHRRLTKPLLIAAVIMALLVCGILGANAATNGALFKGVSLILNGEKVDINRYATSDSYIDDEGNVKITLDLSDVSEDNGGGFGMEIEANEDGDTELSIIVDNNG